MQLRYDDCDSVRLSLFQLLRLRIGFKPQLPHGIFDEIDFLYADVSFFIEHVRNGSVRNACKICNVFNRHHTLFPSAAPAAS